MSHKRAAAARGWRSVQAKRGARAPSSRSSAGVSFIVFIRYNIIMW